LGLVTVKNPEVQGVGVAVTPPGVVVAVGVAGVPNAPLLRGRVSRGTNFRTPALAGAGAEPMSKKLQNARISPSRTRGRVGEPYMGSLLVGRRTHRVVKS
jgi:hypothetical protein